jgi:DNA-binding transcriptional LysR family regulator
VDLNELSGLRVRPLGEPTLTREIGILEKRGQTLPRAAEAFVEILLASPRTVTIGT